MATLHSVNVGMPADVEWRGSTIRTAVFKRPVMGPVMARRLNIDGDGQGDLAGHGGEIRAVLVYQLEAYEHWRSQLGRADLTPGMFGENFTVDGLTDDAVCIGDRFRIGQAEFEVTQPRVTCFRVGMRLGEPELPQLMVAHHRPGFYLRVVAEGPVEAGDEIVGISRGRHAMSVAEVDALLYLSHRDPDRLRLAVDIPALSPGWVQSFRQLLAPPATVPVAPAWEGFQPLRVTGVRAESTSITSFELAAAQPLPRTRDGDFIVLRADGAGEPSPLRSYSLSGPPVGDTYRISVKREASGRVSGWLHDHVRVGSTIYAAAPRGDFHLTHGDRPVALVSAGVGATPLIAMLHDLVARRSLQRVIWIHTSRDRSSHAFRDEAERLIGQLPHAEQHLFYTGAVPPNRLDDRAIAAVGVPADSEVYLCGPVPFMESMRGALLKVGVPASAIHTEIFGAPPAINPGASPDAPRTRPHLPAHPVADGPMVTFSRANLATRFGPPYRTLLELAEACDIPTRYSCRSGVCHVCTTGVVAGTVGYVRAPLEDAPRGSTLICCAAPTSDIALDM